MVAPLEGIRVVDMSQVLAAPGATAFMADLGADVIKVEPPGGEGMRNSNTAATLGIEVESEINCIFELNNRGKRSIVLNLDSEAGRKLLHKLCESADLFITNMLPASRKRRNLTEGDLWKTNPKLVYCVLSGYGSDGPQADRPAIGQTAFWAGAAIMGLCSDPPNIPSIGIDDYAVTLNVFGSAMVGLRQRDKTGKGQYVEVSLQGTGIWTNAYPISVGLVAKQQPLVHNREQPRSALSNTYLTKDGRWVLLTAGREAYWEPLCRGLGCAEWIDDPRFATLDARIENAKALATLAEERFAQEDLAYWTERLNAAGVTWSPVMTIPEVVADAQPRANGAYSVVNHPTAGPFETLSVPFKVRGADIGVRGPAPELGAHREEILTEEGYSADQIKDLAAAGAFG